MKKVALTAVIAAAICAACHRDLTIPRNCENTPSLCDVTDSAVEEVQAVDGDAEIDASSNDDTSPEVDDGAAADTAADSFSIDVTPEADSPASDTPSEVDSIAVDAAPDACASMICTSPPSATCSSGTVRRTYSSTGMCSAGACTYAPTDTPCPVGEICNTGVCSPPSCAGGLTCAGVSCCESRLLPAGTFSMGRATSGPEADACSTWAVPCDPQEQPQHAATVSSFRLDTFEVTVGRFRKFVAAYPGSKPAGGAGAHPAIAGSGWSAAWDSALPLTLVDLKASLNCDPYGHGTWTETAAAAENKPINCVSWYEAFAFCAWDGGRLPTEAEWEYAAAGGSENRVLPWGNSQPTTALATYGCAGTACVPSDLLTVGSKPFGASRWGQHDLAGSLGEWVYDAWSIYTTTPKNDFAQATGDARNLRGGSYIDQRTSFRSAARGGNAPADRAFPWGFRCARRP